MSPSPACLSLIRRYESLRLKAYLCPAGVWTCGWGHTRGVKPGDTCTPEQAEAWLLEDTGREAEILSRIVKVPLAQGQIDSLVSLAFNMRGGAAALPKKAPKLWAKLHAGDVRGAADEFLDMDRATMPDGTRVVLPGLTRRRREERAMFLEGSCEKS
ncbi:MAG: lysozyme [Acidobacteriales bacterium]|nr:lysozyme [Terriglobales bacterium]